MDNVIEQKFEIEKGNDEIAYWLRKGGKNVEAIHIAVCLEHGYYPILLKSFDNLLRLLYTTIM